jgi:hypothetical protein
VTHAQDRQIYCWLILFSSYTKHIKVTKIIEVNDVSSGHTKIESSFNVAQIKSIFQTVLIRDIIQEENRQPLEKAIPFYLPNDST